MPAMVCPWTLKAAARLVPVVFPQPPTPPTLPALQLRVYRLVRAYLPVLKIIEAGTVLRCVCTARGWLRESSLWDPFWVATIVYPPNHPALGRQMATQQFSPRYKRSTKRQKAMRRSRQRQRRAALSLALLKSPVRQRQCPHAAAGLPHSLLKRTGTH